MTHGTQVTNIGEKWSKIRKMGKNAVEVGSAWRRVRSLLLTHTVSCPPLPHSKFVAGPTIIGKDARSEVRVVAGPRADLQGSWSFERTQGRTFGAIRPSARNSGMP